MCLTFSETVPVRIVARHQYSNAQATRPYCAQVHAPNQINYDSPHILLDQAAFRA